VLKTPSPIPPFSPKNAKTLPLRAKALPLRAEALLLHPEALLLYYPSQALKILAFREG